MHGQRVAYYVCGGEDILSESPPPPGGAGPERVPGIKFGRLFGKTQQAPHPDDTEAVIQKLAGLGKAMNDHPGDAKGDSDIPAGYTYLGQFIAHEVTHDSTGDLLAANLDPNNLSTPEIDLDSLYGGEDGPASEKHKHLYRADGVRLKTGDTLTTGDFNLSCPNDLPRAAQENPDGTKTSRTRALAGDPRNDENLAVAQTHVAFIHFHNKVVSDLQAAGHPADKLFEAAREEVIRHYQWIILYDFLPHIVRSDVLDCVMRHGLRWFKGGEDGLFMPLEFSAAAFRIGHSMVRERYEWNPRRRTGSPHHRAPRLTELFMQTGFVEGGLDQKFNLKSDWIIDWRHFYDFRPLADVPRVESGNVSKKLDTVFDLHLNTVTGFPDEKIEKMQKAITVRNLLRGFYLGLPTGEEAAEWMGETPLTRKEVTSGPHAALLNDPVFQGKTPLWYYILKEAELLGFGPNGTPGNRLGPVGSRIVAETLVGLVKHSSHSILKDRDWRPAYGRRDPLSGETHFGMIDLLHSAGVVSPVSRHMEPHLWKKT
ncbi:MAG TPA: heme peroxidase family protein [Pyrinomonadaceae bacterium]|jgi:hypothetical protein